MENHCLEVRCPLTDCLVKLRGPTAKVVVRLHRHLVLDHKVLEADRECPICKTVYSSKWYVRHHVRAVHLEPKSVRYLINKIDYSEFYKCKQCGKKTTKKSLMIRHIQSHMKQMSSCNKRTDVIKDAKEGSFVKKVFSEGKRMSLIRYSIFDVLGPKGSKYRVVPGLNNTIHIQMTPNACTRSHIEISDVFYTNVNKEVVSVKDTTEGDVITLNDSEDDVSMSEDSDSGDYPVVIVDHENDHMDNNGDRDINEDLDSNVDKDGFLDSEDRDINGQIDINEDLDSNDDGDFNGHIDINKELGSNDDRDINEHIDINEDLDSNDDRDIDIKEEQDDLVAEIEQFMQEEDLLDELEQEIGLNTQ